MGEQGAAGGGRGRGLIAINAPTVVGPFRDIPTAELPTLSVANHLMTWNAFAVALRTPAVYKSRW